MGWTVLYIAFGMVALWLLGEVLLQHKARLRWRLLAFVGFLAVVAGVVLPSIYVIIVGALAFGTGQTLVTLSFRRGDETGWVLGGKPKPNRRRKVATSVDGGGTGPQEPGDEATGEFPGALPQEMPGDLPPQEPAPGYGDVPEAMPAEATAVFAAQPLPDDTGGYGAYDTSGYAAYSGYGAEAQAADAGYGYADQAQAQGQVQDTGYPAQDPYGTQVGGAVQDPYATGQQYDGYAASYDYGAGQQYAAGYGDQYDPYGNVQQAGQEQYGADQQQTYDAYGTYDSYGGQQQYAQPAQEQPDAVPYAVTEAYDPYAEETPPGGVWMPQQRERQGQGDQQQYGYDQQHYAHDQNDQQYRY
jgi:hypothetical protein